MKIQSFFVALMIALFSNTTFADNIIITQTPDWRSVPITIDTATHTYTISGAVPTDTTNYYYSYPGYRCFTEKRNVPGTFLTYNPGTAGTNIIYCYPET